MKFFIFFSMALLLAPFGLAQEMPVLVKDILPGPGYGIYASNLYPAYFIESEETFYFYSRNAQEVSFWESDGTKQGTRPIITFPAVRELTSVIDRTEAPKGVVLGNTAYFYGYDAEHGVELWRTDGTAEGTHMVMDLLPGKGSSVPFGLTVFKGKILFIASAPNETGVIYPYLWSSEGTAETTHRIKQFDIIYHHSPTFHVGTDWAYFIASLGSSGNELWRTDGTLEGTSQATEVVSGGNDRPSSISLIDDKLYFTCPNYTWGYEPWISDGTPEGTRMLMDVVPGREESRPFGFVPAAGSIFFWANDSNGRQASLFATDGTPQGTRQLGDQDVSAAIAFQDKLYYSYWHEKGNVLMASTGGADDFQVIASLPVFFHEFLLATDTVLYFSANNPLKNALELWRTNGTQAGTYSVGHPDEQYTPYYPKHAIVYKDEVYFTAYNESVGRELWKLVQPESMLSGRVFLDLNGNGLADEGEPGLSQQVIDLAPVNTRLLTGQDGHFLYFPDPDAPEPATYTASLLASPDWNLSGSESSYPFRTPGRTHLNFALVPATNRQAINTSITSLTASRCSFEAHLWLDVVNMGTVFSEGAVELQLDPQTTLLECTPPPLSQQNGLLRWEFENLPPTGQTRMYLKLLMPDFNSMGDTLRFYSQASIRDTNVLARDTLEQIVRCAYDPNDKLVKPAGIQAEHYTLKNSWLDYTIRFQNVGNDTAFNVLIRDTLDLNLHLQSLEILGSSHPMQASSNGRALAFRFHSILLPDSTTNEPESHGFVRYRIKAKAGVAENTVVENTAHIFFDFNPAIVTNTTFNTLVSKLPERVINGLPKGDAPGLHLYPNPTSGEVRIKSATPFRSLSIRNAMGQVVHEEILPDASRAHTLSLATLPPGLYLLEVGDGREKLRKRLIKK